MKIAKAEYVAKHCKILSNQSIYQFLSLYQFMNEGNLGVWINSTVARVFDSH